MTLYIRRRHLCAWLLLAWASQAPAAGQPGVDAMIDFDGVYIPPLFLTGAAGKSAEGPARAQAALARLQAQWPALRLRMQAVWPGDASWRRSLQAVEGHIGEAARQAARAAWPDAHEALEHVRKALWLAREARGMDYLLDRFVAFHEPMEHLAGAAQQWTPATLGATQRAELARHFGLARARWHGIESQHLDTTTLRLSAARAAQLRRAMAEEGAALTALSQALRGDDAAVLLKAAAAIKPPFVRAYTAFGFGDGEERR